VTGTSLAIAVLIAGAATPLGTALSKIERQVFSFIYRQVEDWHRATDLRQEVFLAVAKHAGGASLPPFASPEDFSSYVLGVAANKVRLHFRSVRIRGTPGQLRPDCDAAAPHEAAPEAVDLCEVILRHLNGRYADALRVEYLGATGAPEAPHVLTRARQAALRAATSLGVQM